MEQHALKKTPEQMIEGVFALDLDPIKFKLMDANEGYGWTRAEADGHELEYKRFLALVAKFPEEAIVPNKAVDRFWHAHILDTMKYAEDCQNIFGYFLHHFPYFGMRDDEDAANLMNASEKTQALYRQEFGGDKQSDAAYCGVAATSYCGAASENASAAYCGVASEKASAAYCGVASEKASAAYCGAASEKSSTAYCGVASEKVSAAYCGVATDKAATAYCGVASDKTAAYCGVVTGKGRPTLEKSAAYCGAATADAGNPAYCGVVTGKGRPTLEEVTA